MTREHLNGDLGDDGGDAENTPHVPTVGDTLTRWRYTLAPTLYTDEDSTSSELLWQQVLETRAVRAWLVVLATLIGVMIPVALITAGLLLYGMGH